jgi:starch phosphorylase
LHITLNPEIQMFDIQVKRIHEYKQQTLNIFSIIHWHLTVIGASPAKRLH